MKIFIGTSSDEKNGRQNITIFLIYKTGQHGTALSTTTVMAATAPGHTSTIKQLEAVATRQQSLLEDV